MPTSHCLHPTYDNSATKCRYCNAFCASEAYFHESSFVDVLNGVCSSFTSKRVEKGKEKLQPTYTMETHIQTDCVQKQEEKDKHDSTGE